MIKPTGFERTPGNDESDLESQSYWMRGHYSFAQLCHLATILAQHPRGLRPSELNHLALDSQAVRTRQGKSPAATTLYHMRRAMLMLGIARYRDKALVVANDDPVVTELIESSQGKEQLAHRERILLAELVIRNDDCRRLFFDLFMVRGQPYAPGDFVRIGQPVTWIASSLGRHLRHVTFTSETNTVLLKLEREVQIQAVLYGIRYWARDELLLVDELFIEGRGNILFPISEPSSVETGALIGAILGDISSSSEWTTMSVEDIILKWAISWRIPVAQIHKAIMELYRNHPDKVALGATPRSLATLTTSSHFRQNLELKKYVRGDDGRYISHVRLHRQLLEGRNDRGNGKVRPTL